jgi:hypothetical protein
MEKAMTMNAETVKDLSVEEFERMSEQQKNDALFLMSDMQRSLFMIRLNTHRTRESGRRLEAKTRAVRASKKYEEIDESEMIGLYLIDKKYVLTASDPYEMSRRMRELCCKRISVYESRGKDVDVSVFARYDRDATIVSNMETIIGARKYVLSLEYI